MAHPEKPHCRHQPGGASEAQPGPGDELHPVCSPAPVAPTESITATRTATAVADPVSTAIDETSGRRGLMGQAIGADPTTVMVANHLEVVNEEVADSRGSTVSCPSH